MKKLFVLIALFTCFITLPVYAQTRSKTSVTKLTVTNAEVSSSKVCYSDLLPIGGLAAFSIKIYSPELGTPTAKLYGIYSNTFSAEDNNLAICDYPEQIRMGAVLKEWTDLSTDPVIFTGTGNVPFIKLYFFNTDSTNSVIVYIFGIDYNGQAVTFSSRITCSEPNCG